MGYREIINNFLQSDAGQQVMQAATGAKSATGATGGGTTPTDKTRMPVRTRVDGSGGDSRRQEQLQSYIDGKVNNYAELEDFILQRMDEYKPESDEDREKREKREKRLMFLSNIGDILGAMHRGYAYQRGVQPMELPNMSEKARARFEKAKADRERESDRYMNYALTLGKIKDSQAAAELDAEYKRSLAKKYQDEHSDRLERMELDRYKLDVQERIAQGKFDLQAELNQIRKDYYDKKISVDQMNARTAAARAEEARRHNRAMEAPTTSQSTVTEDNGYGGVTTKTTTRTTTRGGSSGGSGGNTGGTLKPNRLGL